MSKTFVKISNEQIYEEIKDLHSKIESMQIQITSRQDKTNGRVKTSHWIGSTALSLTLVAIGLMLQHIAK